MAQATEAHTTSRRNFLVIAGGLAAASVPLVASSAEPAISPELLALRDSLYEAHVILEERNSAVMAALDRFDEWKRKNPEPLFIGVNGKQDLNFAETCSLWTAERDAATAERSKVVQAHLPAIKKFTACADDLYDYDAKTFAEIMFKAEVANECDTEDHAIAHSLTYDLLNFKRAVAAQI